MASASASAFGFGFGSHSGGVDSYQRLRERARRIFDETPSLHCPYFSERVVLNGEGLHHLRYSAERERGKPEQMLKFRLLPLALEVIQTQVKQ